MKQPRLHFVFSLFFALLSYVLFTSYSGGFDEDRTGSPLSGGTCWNCHFGGTGGGSITLTGAPVSYTHGTTYTMTLTVTDADMERAGFQITALDLGDNYVGTFIETPLTIRETTDFTGLTHGSPQTAVGGTTAWNIQWTAPNSGNARVKFYYAGNAATAGGTGDDYIYTGFSANIPLPLTLVRFEAKSENGNTLLTWQTENEINTDFFEIEKQNHKGVFEKIAQMPTENKGFYLFNDENAKNGVQYYRLKTVDKDGRFEYSKIETVYIKKENTVRLYPNLIAKNASIWIEKENNDTENVEIINASGQIIKAIQLNENRTKLDLDLPQGTYFAKIGQTIHRLVVFL